MFFWTPLEFHILQLNRGTIVMWDQSFLLRHATGGSFANYDQVLDEAIARGPVSVGIENQPFLFIPYAFRVDDDAA